jgi:hypothetical protein
MAILTQFLFRTIFGLALAMACTSPRKVTSGYFRNHLYVLLGLNVLSTLVAIAEPSRFPIWPAAAAAVLSYVGAVAWLYEKPVLGRPLLVVLAVVALVGAWLAPLTSMASTMTTLVDHDRLALFFRWIDAPTSGFLLGTTLAAMFLGHWYLNTPTMELVPLNRLLNLAFAAVALRTAVCGIGLAEQCLLGAMPVAAFVTLRWLAGLIGLAILIWMARQTLKIPNTQSATGILYVAVLGAFLGELTSQLLSAGTLFPV